MLKHKLKLPCFPNLITRITTLGKPLPRTWLFTRSENSLPCSTKIYANARLWLYPKPKRDSFSLGQQQQPLRKQKKTQNFTFLVSPSSLLFTTSSSSKSNMHCRIWCIAFLTDCVALLRNKNKLWQGTKVQGFRKIHAIKPINQNLNLCSNRQHLISQFRPIITPVLQWSVLK